MDNRALEPLTNMTVAGAFYHLGEIYDLQEVLPSGGCLLHLDITGESTPESKIEGGKMDQIEERTRQLEAEKEQIERDFPVQIKVQLFHQRAFAGGGGEIAILSFIFGGIAAGVFSAIGRDLWSKANDFCRKIVENQKNRRDNSSTTIVVVFDHRGCQITASLKRLDRKKWRAMSTLYGADPVHLFWEELPARVLEIIELIDKRNEDLAGVKAIDLEPSNIERRWMITKT